MSTADAVYLNSVRLIQYKACLVLPAIKSALLVSHLQGNPPYCFVLKQHSTSCTVFISATQLYWTSSLDQHGFFPKYTGYREVPRRWRGRSKNRSSFISRLYAGSRCCCQFVTFHFRILDKCRRNSTDSSVRVTVPRQGKMAPRRSSRLQGDEADVGKRYC